jgi:hypothetical protein
MSRTHEDIIKLNLIFGFGMVMRNILRNKAKDENQNKSATKSLLDLLYIQIM